MGDLPDDLETLLGDDDLRGQAFAPGAEIPRPIEVSDDVQGPQDDDSGAVVVSLSGR
ncbi:hypothetical protein [Streptomyces sp. NBC_01443]|uniref:hypothetical protein n=1 Tax=Streptomyces sp. NBC_01443 TaxID=2903868 RepID=UPI00225BABBD|nr:hypothetical protein [Streptomyces sp. NBC_01443]MCX4633367.1 hypothetical protein [Streptomyces sp. NBC_01443]